MAAADGAGAPALGAAVVVVPEAGEAVAVATDVGDTVAVSTPPESRAEGDTVGAADDPALAAEGDTVAGAAVVASIPPPDGKGEVGSAAVGGGDGVGVGPSVG